MFAGIIQSEPLLLRLPPSPHHWYGDSCLRNTLSLRHRVVPLVLSTGTTGLSTGEYDWLVLFLTPDTWWSTAGYHAQQGNTLRRGISLALSLEVRHLPRVSWNFNHSPFLPTWDLTIFDCNLVRLSILHVNSPFTKSVNSLIEQHVNSSEPTVFNRLYLHVCITGSSRVESPWLRTPECLQSAASEQLDAPNRHLFHKGECC